MKTRWVALLVSAVLFGFSAPAQEEHAHHHAVSEKLGTVHFPTSCRPDAAAEFTRAVALLHSFGYQESRIAFQSVAQKDPTCAMAHWGVAMTYYHPIWPPPSPAELTAGKAEIGKATEIGGGTDRERGYIGALREFYRDSETVGHAVRARAYRDALEALSERFPDDHEARIFYALEIRGTASETDPTYADQKRAAKILNDLLAIEPDHPGIAHYLIHAFDYPALAREALPAARAYAKIAPSSPHALHMPSHIFTRLGLWRDSIDSNLASADAARRLVAIRHPGAASFDALHALDYLEYAYLQIGDLDRARGVLEEATKAKTLDAPEFAAGYAIAAIPARWSLERRDWKAAAELAPSSAELPWDHFPYAPAVTHFARALGAARAGQVERAREPLRELEKIHAGLVKSPIPGTYDWTGQVESMRLGASAWLAFADGRKDEALTAARSAAELEDTVGKHAVTPGALLPARELYGDMLLEAGRPAEALAAYEAALRDAPNRFNSLNGAARAAAHAGQAQRARELYARLIDQSVEGSQRPELAEARRYLKQPG